MSETKSGGKTVGVVKIFATIAKFCYGSENFAMCVKFSLYVIAIFFF